MKVLLLDTNVVSILFKKTHPLRPACLEAVSGQQLVISFLTRAELTLWPIANNWGEPRLATLAEHMALYTTLYPDVRTCAIWAEVVNRCRRTGQPIQTADAWIASAAAVGCTAGDYGFPGLCPGRRSGRRADSIAPPVW